MNGSDAALKLRAKVPSAKILSITAHREPERLARIWRSGVDALTEKYDDREFRMALDAIRIGKRYIHPECSQLVLKAQDSHIPCVHKHRHVLQLLAQGLTYRAIGQRLHKSEHSIAKYVNDLKQECGAHNRAHLVALAIEHCWIEPPFTGQDRTGQDRTGQDKIG